MLLAAVIAQQFPPQVIRMNLSVGDDGRFAVDASTFGADRVDLDVTKLRLFARRHDGGGETAPTCSLSIRFRGPAAEIPGQHQSFSIPVAFDALPGLPGIYDIWATTNAGFATTNDGRSIPLFKNGAFSASSPTVVFWPDESHEDRELAAIRRRFVSHDVYGFGRVAISCRPDFTLFYDATTPVRVRSIERERGRVTYVGTGPEASAPYVNGTGFVAFDPLLFVVDEPSGARYTPLGRNAGVGGSPTQCPAIELADFQVETTLALRPSPLSAEEAEAPRRVGMTRTAVIWSHGYPNEIGSRAEILANPVWDYGVGLGRYKIRFAHQRIASFTKPSTL